MRANPPIGAGSKRKRKKNESRSKGGGGDLQHTGVRPVLGEGGDVAAAREEDDAGHEQRAGQWLVFPKRRRQQGQGVDHVDVLGRLEHPGVVGIKRFEPMGACGGEGQDDVQRNTERRELDRILLFYHRQPRPRLRSRKSLRFCRRSRGQS